jgi:hypothetical protein
MSSKPQDERTVPTIYDLYPTLSEQEAIEAQENLRRYVQLALEIYERIRENPQLYATLRHLTDSQAHPSMHTTPSNPSK